MVAYEAFDTGSSGYKHEDQKTQFSDAVDKYDSSLNKYSEQISKLRDDLHNVINLSGGDSSGMLINQYATPNYISPNDTADASGVPLWSDNKPMAKNKYAQQISTLNAQYSKQLSDQLKTLERISKHNIGTVHRDDSALRDSIENDGIDGIGPDNKVMTGDNYDSNLAKARREQQKLLDDIDIHDGEFHDAKLQRKSYHLHSIIFSIIFVVVVGLIFRAVLTDQSDAIETVILFLGIALALYYLIEYIF